MSAGLPVRHSDPPLTCVVLGAGHSLEEFDALEGLEGSWKRRGLRRSRRVSFARQAERTIEAKSARQMH